MPKKLVVFFLFTATAFCSLPEQKQDIPITAKMIDDASGPSSLSELSNSAWVKALKEHRLQMFEIGKEMVKHVARISATKKQLGERTFNFALTEVENLSKLLSLGKSFEEIISLLVAQTRGYPLLQKPTVIQQRLIRIGGKSVEKMAEEAIKLIDEQKRVLE